MLDLVNINMTFYPGTPNENHVLHHLNLHLDNGDFVTVIGGNGAGKSTMLNIISGQYFPESGQVLIENQNVTWLPEHKRASYLGRVFQDPMQGTAGDMGIDENLALAARRGNRRGLSWGIRKDERASYRKTLQDFGLGLEGRMSTKVRRLSGGQRQALTLLMATLRKPSILLLDEHTAALDPKTGARVLDLTRQLIEENNLTTLMITHNMREAIQYGNRLIMMHAGQIILDIRGSEKQALTVEDLLHQFEKASGTVLDNDRMLLA
ncbi:MAG: ATP-binding cassette domain-containing protein [Ruminococcaceae bacterium]|nr:ATP-binding cassette domain-containing protein [Oscillospiraceae bacterium]